jgi:hypothetical protein
LVSNTATVVNQTCILCNSNCYRCLTTNTNACTACRTSLYLNNNNSTCISCPTGCASCISINLCFTCTFNYIPQIAASLVATSIQPVTCIACQYPCATCVGSISTCVLCQNTYTLQGTQCVSNFNFQVQCTLTANATVFN